jgi:hypothetical protein
MALPAHAATIISNDFDNDAEGWTNGDFRFPTPTSSLTYDAVNEQVTTTDVFGYNAFIASAGYIGDQSGAFGGTIQFDLSSQFNDAPTVYAPLTLIGNGLTLYADPLGVPSTDPNSPTTFVISLLGSSFRTADAGGGSVVTDAQLMGVLGSLEQLAINGDWNSGGDFVTLDKVALCDSGGCDTAMSAVPEPGTWLMMILGFGLIGGSMRSAKRQSRGLMTA